MKEHITPQVKYIRPAAISDIPSIGYRRLHTQAIVQLHQAIVEMIDRPDARLVTGKGRIERGDSRRVIVVEYL